ncbi:uncharacterized protein LOC122400245 [Colletes gigas]|uniref:uncharacterized protein LOC122400245 n=1 Tax=Colletes gigas TaxID=935657 RepID=UPI001C9B4519|nr:uncharacterized protein LOC122400245 [Colletes gigas]
MFSFLFDRFHGTSDDFFSCAKADRFVMAKPKGNVTKIEPPPYRERMELRSMSRRSPPPYPEIDSPKNLNSQDDSTLKEQNDSDKTRLEESVDSATIITSNCCGKFPRYICYRIGGFSMIIITVVLLNFLFPYPLHASCVVKWKFGDSCVDTMQKLRWQILDWSSCINCGSRGSRCLYTLEESKPDESNVIRAVHVASNTRTVETIKIIFEEVNKTCVATGESVSNEWFRIFDYGINYCNLHNLVTGLGYDKSPRFLELTTNAVCTQYNMAVCG